MSLEYTETEQDDGAIGLDPLYLQTLNLMQQGQWHEAAQALAVLEHHYPDYPELRQAQQILSLHLSAEQTWVEGPSGPTIPDLRAAGRRAASSLGSAATATTSTLGTPIVRALVLANVVVYLLLGTMLVFGEVTRLLH